MKRRNFQMKYLRYLSYVLRHKWFVFVECCRFGIPWLGVIHDWKKFTPRSFCVYANHFYGDGQKDQSQKRDSTGYYKPYNTGDKDFDMEVWKHCRDHKHHWQYWIKPMDGGGCEPLPIPLKYRKEMLADWIGAGKAQGTTNTKEWWLNNSYKLQLNITVKTWLHKRIMKAKNVI